MRRTALPRYRGTVLVIGGGVVGLFCALSLHEQGFRVRVLERGGPLHDACSFGNAGMVVPSHIIPLASPGMVRYGLKLMTSPESPFGVHFPPDPALARWFFQFWRSGTRSHVKRAAPLLRDLSLESRRLFEAFAASTGNPFGLAQRGLLMLCNTGSALAEEARTVKRAVSLGMNARMLSASEVMELEPETRLSVRGAAYFPQDCHLDPVLLMETLRRRLMGLGVEFLFNSPVVRLHVRGEQAYAARTPAGWIRGDAFVLAAGARSSSLARRLGISLPLQGGKGYSLTVPESPIRLRRGAILVEARVSITPLGNSLRLGGTLELGARDTTVNPNRLRGLRRSLLGYLPEVREADLTGIPVWSGLRPCSPDGLPYIGPFTRIRNLFAATGHAMMGVSLAPVTGKLIGEIVAGEPPSIPLRMLDANRFD